MLNTIQVIVSHVKSGRLGTLNTVLTAPIAAMSLFANIKMAETTFVIIVTKIATGFGIVASIAVLVLMMNQMTMILNRCLKYALKLNKYFVY